MSVLNRSNPGIITIDIIIKIGSVDSRKGILKFVKKLIIFFRGVYAMVFGKKSTIAHKKPPVIPDTARKEKSRNKGIGSKRNAIKPHDVVKAVNAQGVITSLKLPS